MIITVYTCICMYLPNLSTTNKMWGSLHGTVANLLDCDIVVVEFELWSHYYSYLPTLLLRQDLTEGQFLSEV